MIPHHSLTSNSGHRTIVMLLVGTFLFLSLLQVIFDSETMTTIGICTVAVAFGYKLWLFCTSAWVMRQQRGTSRLAKAGLAFFCALAAMALAMTMVFSFASMDRLAYHFSETFPQVELIGVRNVARNFAITTVVAVVIYGSRMMDAVFAMREDQRANELP